MPMEDAKQHRAKPIPVMFLLGLAIELDSCSLRPSGEEIRRSRRRMGIIEP